MFIAFVLAALAQSLPDQPSIGAPTGQSPVVTAPAQQPGQMYGSAQSYGGIPAAPPKTAPPTVLPAPQQPVYDYSPPPQVYGSPPATYEQSYDYSVQQSYGGCGGVQTSYDYSVQQSYGGACGTQQMTAGRRKLRLFGGCGHRTARRMARAGCG